MKVERKKEKKRIQSYICIGEISKAGNRKVKERKESV